MKISVKLKKKFGETGSMKNEDNIIFGDLLVGPCSYLPIQI